jgi:hypothetical protein
MHCRTCTCPQNQAQWFVSEVVRVAPWLLAHPWPVLQGDFEVFSNFVPFRAATIALIGLKAPLWATRGRGLDP